MKDVELKLICELMKNSRKSDRDLARAIGCSQPTVSRVRGKLEKEEYLKKKDISKNILQYLTFTSLDLKSSLLLFPGS